MQLAMCRCTAAAREINFNFYILYGGFAVNHTPKRYLANKKDLEVDKLESASTSHTTASEQDNAARDLANKIFSKNENLHRKFNSDDSKEIAKQIISDYPEPPTTCCMSGCANCVWVDYAEKLTEYYKDGGQKAIAEINERVTDDMMKSFLLFELRMRKT